MNSLFRKLGNGEYTEKILARLLLIPSARMRPNAIPRTLAAILLIVSLTMLFPIGAAVAGMLRGNPVASSAWSIPLIILATGFALISFLPKMQTYGQLYLSAFALWILAAGYFLFVR